MSLSICQQDSKEDETNNIYLMSKKLVSSQVRCGSNSLPSCISKAPPKKKKEKRKNGVLTKPIIDTQTDS